SAFAGLTMSGAVETSASINTARNGALTGRSFDGADRQDGFNFNSARLTLEKAVSEDQFGAGFRTDLVYGPDADAFYGNSPIKQAYVALRAPVGNGIDIKMGVFDTPIGYEQFDSGSNPNFSRSYGFNLEPNHHTGVLASYKVVDALSLSAGVANTGNDFLAQANNAVAREGRLAYLGTATITLPEGTGALKGSTINLGIIREEGPTAQVSTINYYAGATVNTGITGLQVGAAFDHVQDPESVMHSKVWSLAGYVSYALTEKLKLNGRYDTIQTDDGDLQSVTLTAQYDLWANVLTRLEGRWDTGEHVFGANGNSSDAFTIAADVIYKF
ncbi:MAG: outer membrane beta-barrel protein, partial [Verrucomicrobia bacterium]|nr:outer membrane beta-barrel protein [Verrucomicrobiota bacterium]